MTIYRRPRPETFEVQLPQNLQDCFKLDDKQYKIPLDGSGSISQELLPAVCSNKNNFVSSQLLKLLKLDQNADLMRIPAIFSSDFPSKKMSLISLNQPDNSLRVLNSSDDSSKWLGFPGIFFLYGGIISFLGDGRVTINLREPRKELENAMEVLYAQGQESALAQSIVGKFFSLSVKERNLAKATLALSLSLIGENEELDPLAIITLKEVHALFKIYDRDQLEDEEAGILIVSAPTTIEVEFRRAKVSSFLIMKQVSLIGQDQLILQDGELIRQVKNYLYAYLILSEHGNEEAEKSLKEAYPELVRNLKDQERLLTLASPSLLIEFHLQLMQLSTLYGDDLDTEYFKQNLTKILEGSSLLDYLQKEKLEKGIQLSPLEIMALESFEEEDTRISPFLRSLSINEIQMKDYISHLRTLESLGLKNQNLEVVSELFRRAHLLKDPGSALLLGRIAMRRYTHAAVSDTASYYLSFLEEKFFLEAVESYKPFRTGFMAGVLWDLQNKSRISQESIYFTHPNFNLMQRVFPRTPKEVLTENPHEIVKELRLMGAVVTAWEAAQALGEHNPERYLITLANELPLDELPEEMRAARLNGGQIVLSLKDGHVNVVYPEREGSFFASRPFDPRELGDSNGSMAPDHPSDRPEGRISERARLALPATAQSSANGEANANKETDTTLDPLKGLEKDFDLRSFLNKK